MHLDGALIKDFLIKMLSWVTNAIQPLHSLYLRCLLIKSYDSTLKMDDN